MTDPVGAAGPVVGFIGLGNMGSILAGNLVSAGFDVIGHDAAGTEERLPAGVRAAGGVSEIAAVADIVLLSLPDGTVSLDVGKLLLAAQQRRFSQVVDTSTIGPHYAVKSAGLFGPAGIGYVDAPVSGGLEGARARTLTVMFSGPPEACAVVAPVLAGLSDNRRRVGDRAGLAQALKLANNFLSATALAATSEAVAFGTSLGLDMALMLDVINVSSGRSAATEDKFPKQVVTQLYSAGFANDLMAKDVTLYLAEAGLAGSPRRFGDLTAEVWNAFAADRPATDFTAIYPYIEGR